MRNTYSPFLQVSDIHSRLPELALPTRSLTLLNNRGTFFLLRVNGDPRAAADRLSLSLHYTLHNEFFSATTRTGEKVDVTLNILNYF